MIKLNRNHVGANLVEYIIPVAVVGIVVGMGVYFLTDGGKLSKFLVSSTNSTLDNAKKLSINAGSNPLSNTLAGSRKWLTQNNVFYTNENNQTCIFFYCVGGSSPSTNTLASSIPTTTTPVNDVNSILAATTTVITNIVNSSSGNVSPAVLETINSVISSATQTISNITQPVNQVIDPLLSAVNPTNLIAQILPQQVLETIVESNTQIAATSGDQSGSSQSTDEGNLAALNDFLSNIPSSVTSGSSDNSSGAVETAGSAGDVDQIGGLINQVAGELDTEVASNPSDPKLQQMSDLLKQIANKTVYNSGLAETQKKLENHVNSSSGASYSGSGYIDPYYYNQYYYTQYGGYPPPGYYQTGGLAATAISNYMNSVTVYTDQMSSQLKEINDLHQQFKDLAASDDKYKPLLDKIGSLVGDVNNINANLNNQSRNIYVTDNANSFTVNGIQYTNSQQTDTKGQNIGNQSSST